MEPIARKARTKGMLFLELILLASWAPQVQQPDATAIMAQVAANQDRAIAGRRQYIYVQHARVSSRKGKTIRCEEVTDTRIVPSESGYTEQLLKLEGKLLVKGNYVSYDKLPPPDQRAMSNMDAGEQDLNISIDDSSTTDRDLVENMRHNVTNDNSKDGIRAGLFPLSSKAQANYVFHFVNQEKMNGRDVFHITFAPKDKSDYDWKGDAYIDTTAYEPVVVRTRLAKNVPFAVRTLLGTSVPGLGFTIIYAPQPADKPGAVWFPVSFGTEFKMHVLFFFNREITIAAENRNFEMTHVTSRILPAVE